jgi:hypothetical protein
MVMRAKVRRAAVSDNNYTNGLGVTWVSPI